MAKSHRLHALLHPTVIGDGFLVPLFLDQRLHSSKSFVQNIEDGSVRDLKAVKINRLDNLIGINNQIEINIGDKAVFAFKSRSAGTIVGDAGYVTNELKSIIDDYAEKPFLRRSIEGFISEQSQLPGAQRSIEPEQGPAESSTQVRQQRLGKISSFSGRLMSRPSEALDRPAIAARVGQLTGYGADVNVIGLGGGEPDFDTPDYIKDAAISAIRGAQTRYTNVDGTPALKEAIQTKFKRDNKIDYDFNQISVNVGSKHTLFNALVATVEAGDEVIVPAPYWVSYPDIIRFAGGTPVFITTSAAQKYKITPEQLDAAITSRTKWLILNSPSNPTGAAYSIIELKALGEVIERHPNVWVIADDIYEHIVYDDFKFATIAQVCPSLYDRTLTVNGCSKAYAMSGWRIGFAGGPSWLIKAMAKLQSQSTSNPSSIAQAAATAALNGDQSFLMARKEAFQSRRDLVVSMLNQIEGITCPRPQGAFYVFPDFSPLIGKMTPKGQVITNDEEMVRYILDEAHVVAVPGAVFGHSTAMRISYAIAEVDLTQACQRIQLACSALKG